MPGYYATWKEGTGEMSVYRLVWVSRPSVNSRQGQTETLTNFFTVSRADMEAELERRNCSGPIMPGLLT